MMRHWDGSWGIGNWLVMGFGMLVFWALVVAVVIWLVRYSGIGRSDQPDLSASRHRQTAREILDERYARGEISDEDYRSRRDALASR